MIYALDTNAIIDVLNKETAIVNQLNNVIMNKTPVVIPSAVDYEITRGFYHTSIPRKEIVYRNMRLYCPVIETNADIWNCAAQIWANLRKRGLTIGDFDILIAAYCAVNNYTLVTNNIKHFKDIAELNFEDWAKTINEPN